PNQAFRLPDDPDHPMIMIGPGTGIAPFRAFLHERRAAGATGKNWLFFGNPNAATDYFYRDELEDFLRARTLTRLNLAFSREQACSLYVPHRLVACAPEMYAWIEEGAHLYVCGDAARMAADVHNALLEIISRGAGISSEKAAERV